MVRPLVALLFLTAAGNLLGQTTSPNSVAGLCSPRRPRWDAAPDFAAWRNLHPNERLKNASYDNEYETQGLWCAASVADFAFPGGVKATRQAFFYIPSGNAAGLLPDHQDAGLLRQCRLLALWYEVNSPVDSGALAKSVSAEFVESLGSADEPSQFQKRDGDWGSGYWSPYRVWESANRRVVLTGRAATLAISCNYI